MYSTIGLSMPTDYEMLVSHSPPIFNSYLTDYSSTRYSREHIPRFARNSCRSVSANSFITPSKNSNMPATPRRPCLVIRPEETVANDEDPTSPTRLKKKVVFADDRGMSLTHVRVMTEPSNVPPLLNSRFLTEVTQGLTADPVSKDSWEVTFAQPASDYLEFRKKLELNKISLENVIVKESEELLIGTVKVSNISFEKEVIVRSSFNTWKSYEDTFCQYVSNSCSSSAVILYDTFSFKLLLPPKGKRIEFCVCFRCTAGEFWDNNGGNNYVLTKKDHHEPPAKSLSADDLLKRKEASTKFSDALHAKVESWSQFASWNHLENSSPYW